MNGKRIKNLRKRMELTATQLANMLGTTQVTIYRWEKGLHDPDDETKKKLAAILNTSVAYLIGESNNHPQACSLRTLPFSRRAWTARGPCATT
jgi:transcriptional regulator with XRE-family HTH domain